MKKLHHLDTIISPNITEKSTAMSEFNKMSRQKKRSARLLALQFIYANEITSIDQVTFFDDILNISSSINGFEQKAEILSDIDLSSDMALSVLPENFTNKYKIMRSKLDRMESKEIINLINLKILLVYL